jgi:hypothetical protein
VVFAVFWLVVHFGLIDLSALAGPPAR